jgi:steroid delta-isomerase-like uncharacterized protein
MSYSQKKTLARKFVQEIFNEGKLDNLNKYVTPDIIWHGAEEIRGLEEFKQWISEDLNAFPDMQFTILDDLAEQNKVAIRWTMKATHTKEFIGLPATQKAFETKGTDFLHFENDKIKEAWTVFDGLTPALEVGVVELVQPAQAKI